MNVVADRGKEVELMVVIFCISGSGIAINSICVNESFCVTASDDRYLRMWPLDFKAVYLEAGKITDMHLTAAFMH